MTRHLGPGGIALIQHAEGCKFAAYPDPGSGAEPWTIGFGHTGPEVHHGLIWTRAQCDAGFVQDVARFVAGVAGLIGNAPTTQNQFDALVSFQYNVKGGLKGTTLLKKHLAGDHAGAAAEFGKWCHADGHVMPGLVTRRAAEAALYLKPQE